MTPVLSSKTHELTTGINYRPEIDGLRALAILAVIINHSNPALLPSGYLGVDIFFVISGYVITNSLMKDKSRHIGEVISAFYGRRIKRLFPALIACVLITSLLICLFDPRPSESLKTGITALLGGSNIYLLTRATDYFAPSTQLNVFTHTWSLGVEEQFYLFYPILIWYALRPPQSRRLLKLCIALIATLAAVLVLSKSLKGSALAFLPGGISTVYMLLPYACVALAIPVAAYLKPSTSHLRNARGLLTLMAALSLCLFWFAYDRNFPAAYFLMPARFWELAAGCLLFLWTFDKRQPRLPKGFDLGIIILLVLSLFLPESLGKQATMITVALTTCLIGSLRPNSKAFQILTHPRVVTIGLISYSLYLWHWTVLSLGRWTIGTHPLSLAIEVALMLLLAFFSYYQLELPFRRSRVPRSNSRILAYGFTAIILAISSLFTLKSQAQHFSLDRLFPSDLAKQFDQGVTAFNANRIDHRVYPEKLTASLTHSEDGKLLPHPRIYLFGDSHADHYKDALAEALPDFGVGSASIGWRCGYISPRDIESLTRQLMDGCETYKTLIDAFIDTEIQHNDIVILSQRWNEKKVGNHLLSTLDHLASKLGKHHASLIFIDGVPELAVENPLLCEKRPWRPFPMSGCFQPLATVNQNFEKMDDIGSALEQRHVNVHYLQLRQLYCEGSVCGPYINNTMIYKDNNHLNRSGARIGAKKIADHIRMLHGG